MLFCAYPVSVLLSMATFAVLLQVAFADPSHSGRLSVKRWVQATSKWEYVGPPAISPSPVQRAPCLTFSPKGEPWIAFQVRCWLLLLWDCVVRSAVWWWCVWARNEGISLPVW